MGVLSVLEEVEAIRSWIERCLQTVFDTTKRLILLLLLRLQIEICPDEVSR